MYAIVDIAGKQYKVEKNKFIYTNRLAGEAGSKVSFDNVLLISDNGKTDIGAPAIKGAAVSGTILNHLKDDKVVSFKMKRRKGFRKKVGHRQPLTKVLIDNITK
jgi:large subunit ribosomal protein L21